jgi:hypothetical protein
MYHTKGYLLLARTLFLLINPAFSSKENIYILLILTLTGFANERDCTCAESRLSTAEYMLSATLNEAFIPGKS